MKNTYHTYEYYTFPPFVVHYDLCNTKVVIVENLDSCSNYDFLTIHGGQLWKEIIVLPKVHKVYLIVLRQPHLDMIHHGPNSNNHLEKILKHHTFFFFNLCAIHMS